MNDNPLPDAQHVATLLTSLLGDKVTAKARKEALDLESAGVKASYIDGNGAPKKILFCDLPFANGMGAALTRIPSGAVTDANKAGEVPENIYENLYEVLNICVNLFPTDPETHVVLGEVYKPERNSEELLDNSMESVVSFDVEVPRYGAGVLCLADLAGAPASA